MHREIGISAPIHFMHLLPLVRPYYPHVAHFDMYFGKGSIKARFIPFIDPHFEDRTLSRVYLVRQHLQISYIQNKNFI